MNWHVVLRVGANDVHTIEVPPETPRMFVSLDRTGDLFVVQQNVLGEIADRTGGRPPSLAADLLVVAMAVFAADLRISRGTAGDRWGREMTLHVPVFNLTTWQGLTPELVRMLNFLTGDSWAFEFRLRAPVVAAALPARPRPTVAQDVALFSGGLDSLAGAIDLLESGRSLILVGHYGAGVTNSVQQAVLSALQGHYGERVVPCMFHVQPRKHKEADEERKAKDDGEQSMRSRSFLFFALGAAVATALGDDRRLVVSENGFISLNVPLTNPRMGSCSTRTTHPHFVGLFRELLGALGPSRAK